MLSVKHFVVGSWVKWTSYEAPSSVSDKDYFRAQVRRIRVRGWQVGDLGVVRSLLQGRNVLTIEVAFYSPQTGLFDNETWMLPAECFELAKEPENNE